MTSYKVPIVIALRKRCRNKLPMTVCLLLYQPYRSWKPKPKGKSRCKSIQLCFLVGDPSAYGIGMTRGLFFQKLPGYRLFPHLPTTWNYHECHLLFQCLKKITARHDSRLLGHSQCTLYPIPFTFYPLSFSLNSWANFANFG
jgi:hypothetical protein